MRSILIHPPNPQLLLLSSMFLCWVPHICPPLADVGNQKSEIENQKWIRVHPRNLRLLLLSSAYLCVLCGEVFLCEPPELPKSHLLITDHRFSVDLFIHK